MKAPHRWITALLTPLVLLAVILMSTPLQAQLYTENFNNTSGSNTNSASVGWNSYFTTSATDFSNLSAASLSGTVDYVTISNADGNPMGVKGYLAFANNVTTTNASFASVKAFASGLDLANGYTISWTEGNNNSSAAVRLLLQIGGTGTVGSGTWVASTSTFTTSSANLCVTAASFSAAVTANLTKTVTFSTDKALWSSFTLNPTSSMTLGSALTSDLSSSTITGIGFYLYDTTQSVVRLDSLQIVPEPTTYALVGAAALFLLISVSHKRRLTRTPVPFRVS